MLLPCFLPSSFFLSLTLSLIRDFTIDVRLFQGAVINTSCVPHVSLAALTLLWNEWSSKESDSKKTDNSWRLFWFRWIVEDVVGICKRCHRSESYISVWPTSIPGIHLYFCTASTQMFYYTFKLAVSQMSLQAHSLPYLDLLACCSSLPVSFPDTKTHSHVYISSPHLSFVFFGCLKANQTSSSLNREMHYRQRHLSCCCGLQTQPREHWLTQWQYHGWHVETSDGWHSDTQVSRQRWQSLMDAKTLLQTFFTRCDKCYI